MGGTIQFGRLSDCTFDQAVTVWNEGFEQYFSDMTMNYARYLQHLAGCGISPEDSVVAFDQGKPVGMVLLAFQTWNGRKVAWNGGTGVRLSHRGKGLGKQMMREAERRLKEKQVDTCYLEVVSKNIPAIRIYEHTGFRIVENLIGLQHKGNFEKMPFAEKETRSFHLTRALPMDVGKLDLYPSQVAWNSHWQQVPQGEAHIAWDSSGKAVGYTLTKRVYDLQGGLESIMLHQYEVDPEYPHKDQVILALIAESFAPLNVSCIRRVHNGPVREQGFLKAFRNAGFEPVFEQYLMKWTDK